MKFINISVCALLLAGSACYGLQTTLFSIKNAASNTVYGGIYKASLQGDILDNSKGVYIELRKNECFDVTIQRVSPTDHYRIIFSTDEQAIKDKLRQNTNNSLITSVNILSKYFPQYETGKVCYRITGKNKLAIKAAGEGAKCTACGSNSVVEKFKTLRIHNINE